MDSVSLMYKDCTLHVDLISCLKAKGLVRDKVNSLRTFESIMLKVRGLSEGFGSGYGEDSLQEIEFTHTPTALPFEYIEPHKVLMI